MNRPDKSNYSNILIKTYHLLLLDPNDCRAYFACSRDLSESVRRVCKSNEVFSEASGSCVVSTQCIAVDCNVKMGNGMFTPYGISKKYYALCDTTVVENELVTIITMYQCATGAEFDRSPSVSKCVYKCPGEGKYEYSLENTKYYECIKNSNGWLNAVAQKCPGRSEFIPKDRECGYVFKPPLRKSLNTEQFVKFLKNFQ